MKKKFKRKTYKNKLGKMGIITVILIISLNFFLMIKFNQGMNKNLRVLSEAEIKRATYSLLTDKITNEILNTETLKDILIITKNNNNEILYVDFDLDKAYKILDKVSQVLTTSYQKMEDSDLNIAYLDEELSHKANSVVLNVPMGSLLNSTYFYNLGPKIPVKINFIGTVLTNLETKITNYGLNNALVEVFIYIKFSNQIISPFKVQKVDLEYKTIIASMMVEGEVPSFYNGVIEKESGILKKNED